jgi:hypothetical protein
MHLRPSGQSFGPDLGAATEFKERLRERFGVEHATIEVELSGRVRHGRTSLQEG